MKDGILLVFTGLICAFLGFAVWMINGNAGWNIIFVLLLAGLFVDNFRLRRQLQSMEGENKEEGKVVKIIKMTCHIGFCYFVAPISLVVLCVFSGTYREYPYVGIFTGVLIFLVITTPVFLILRKRKYAARLSLYLLLMVFFPGFLVPQYFVFTPSFLGEMFASRWFSDRHNSDSDRAFYLPLSNSQYEILNEDEAVFFNPDPPVMLFISLREHHPHCMGYPESAERSCTRKLTERVQNKAKSDQE
ncbi:hypothetical protein FACS189441_5880 [Betaproteobacteria bacterium]|nr:hypothetical protein FACS189441_5880 [Betaproteobacteria bacterium]